MGVITSLKAFQRVMDPNKSRWEVVLTSGKVLTENKVIFDYMRGGYRPIDWALDLNSTGDINKIKELWIVCPNGRRAKLDIEEPGIAFQFKYTNRDFLGATGQILEAQCIGKVTDKVNGNCTCWIWDRVLDLIQYDTNINSFGNWRPGSGLIPPHRLSHDVMGLRLG